MESFPGGPVIIESATNLFTKLAEKSFKGVATLKSARLLDKHYRYFPVGQLILS
jgi:hypothetical protein